MQHSGGAGKHPKNCPTCGCPGMETRTVTGDIITEWGYETLDSLMEEVRILNAIIDDKLPRAVSDEARSRYDPARGRVMLWLDETGAEEWFA